MFSFWFVFVFYIIMPQSTDVDNLDVATTINEFFLLKNMLRQWYVEINLTYTIIPESPRENI